LESVRCFERLDLKFEPHGEQYAGWTVVTGDNATGKTTLLKAIALALVSTEAFPYRLNELRIADRTFVPGE
jgi:predicted ATP-binding protein involved in virulence